jgi:hypothetical protein
MDNLTAILVGGIYGHAWIKLETLDK